MKSGEWDIICRSDNIGASADSMRRTKRGSKRAVGVGGSKCLLFHYILKLFVA